MDDTSRDDSDTDVNVRINKCRFHATIILCRRRTIFLMIQKKNCHDSQAIYPWRCCFGWISERHCHYGFWYDNGFVIATLLLLSFGIISNFGLVTVISVFFALIGANIVMPAIPVLAGRVDKDPGI